MLLYKDYEIKIGMTERQRNKYRLLEYLHKRSDFLKDILLLAEEQT